ncbi:hypothetical protein ACFX2A_016524 [Malus domestica]
MDAHFSYKLMIHEKSAISEGKFSFPNCSGISHFVFRRTPTGMLSTYTLLGCRLKSTITPSRERNLPRSGIPRWL